MDGYKMTDKTFWFDVDGVIFVDRNRADYATVKPIKENIELINAIKLLGNTVILFTARGYKTGIDWREVTEKQLQEHKVLYDELLFGKPACDYCVDDRMIDMETLRRWVK